MAASYTKKFKEFDEEYNPKQEDYLVGYRRYDEAETRVPLSALDNIIIANKYVRKDIDDYVNGLITFNKGFRVSGDIMSTIYLQGLNGWKGDKKGNFEMNSLILREFLEVPELRKNKITVMGNQFWFTDSALVKEAIAIGDGCYEVYFKLEDEEYSSFELNDILKGIYHYNNGFWTVFLQVYELILNPDTTGEIGVKVRSMNGKDPRQSMLLVRINNSTDTERQGSIYADGIRKYIRVLDGYDPQNPTQAGSIDTLKLQMGDLSTVTNHPIFGDLTGYGLYGENVYLTGKIIVKNDPNQEGQLLGVYRGYWDPNASYYQYDQVSYEGSLYTSKQINNKGNKPTGLPEDIWWEVTVSKGKDGEADPGLVIELTNENHMVPTDSSGKNPSYGGAFTTVYILKGTTDITELYDIQVQVEYPTDLNKIQYTRVGNTVALTYIADDINSAVIKFTAGAEGYPTLSIDWKISKLKTGPDGEHATAYWLVTDTPVIKKLKTGLFDPTPFVIRAFKQTGSEDIQQYQGYIKLEYGVEIQIISGSTYQFVPISNVDSYIISLYADSALNTLLDKEIVHVVTDGADGVDGKDGTTGPAGADGLQGPSIVFAGNWVGDKQYWAYSDSQTCVYFNGKYYYSKTVSPAMSPLRIPSGDANNPASEAGRVYWNEFVGQFDNIATGLLLADRIATSELSANKIFIVNREEVSGNIITKDGSVITKQEEKNLTPSEIIGRLTEGWYMDQGIIRSIATESINGTLVPKVMMDKDGKLKAVDVNITGTMTINDGFIGNLEVYKDALWQTTVNGPFPASSGFYYLRKTAGVTITPQGHLIGKDYFLSGDSTQGPSVFTGDIYLPGSWQSEDNSLISIMNYWASLFEKVLVGSQYMIKAKLPLFSVGEITAYASENPSIPSIWEGIPVDKVTIDLVDGKLTVIGGGSGGIKGIVLPAMTEEDALSGATLNSTGDTITFTKSTFATKAFLQNGYVPLNGDYATLSTEQTITSTKTFLGNAEDSRGFRINGSKTEYRASSGGWAIGLSMQTHDWATNLCAFGFFGGNDSLSYAYIGNGYDNPWLTIYPNGYTSFAAGIDTHKRVYINTTEAEGLIVVGDEATTSRIYGRIGSSVDQIIAKYEVQWYNAKFAINTYRGGSTDIKQVSFSFNGVDKIIFAPDGTIATSNIIDCAGLGTRYVGSQQSNPQVYFGPATGLSVAMTGHIAVWWDTLWINGYGGGDVPHMCALHTSRQNEPRMRITTQRFDSNSYGPSYEVWTEYNSNKRDTDWSAKSIFSNQCYADNWFRSYGDSGWYNETYGGGIWMQDSVWVRVHNNKKFYCQDVIRSGSYFEVERVMSVQNNWGYILQTPGSYHVLDELVEPWTTQLVLSWKNIIRNAGYRTTYRIGSQRAGDGWGKMVFFIGNNDEQTQGRQLSLGGDGTMEWSGNIIASGEVTAYSDIRLKSKISDLTYRGRLQPKSYVKDGHQSIGFIAQEVQMLYPELVLTTDTKEHYLSLNYGNITAVLSAQLNLVEDEVTLLKYRIKHLEQRLNELEYGR